MSMSAVIIVLFENEVSLKIKNIFGKLIINALFIPKTAHMLRRPNNETMHFVFQFGFGFVKRHQN
jgi:hypothetical protein